MSRHSRAVRLARALSAAAAAVALVLPAPVGAAGDVTPPTGSTEIWDIDSTTQMIELHLTYTDPESGLDHLLVICDSGPEFIVPYTSKLFWPMHDGTGGCSTDFGEHSILVQVYNGDGLSSNASGGNFVNEPSVHLTVSANPTTGHPVTFTPVWTEGYVPPPDQICSWEFRWGTTTALDQTFGGETFGGMFFTLAAAHGGCGPWTLTLPWVPYPQFDVRIGSNAVRFKAAVDSTDRRIRSSNLPIAQVLPNTYTPIVGEPLTYTRYLVGGTTLAGAGNWSARLGDGENPLVFAKTGGSTFTFTPPTTGDVFVEWNQGTTDGNFLDTYYDPPVRRRDTTDPTTSVPAERIRTGIGSPTVPLSISWSGRDTGWGIASYQLQKSVNGGSWTYVGLTSPRATSASVSATAGSTIRFRVRAKDQAGNVGVWRTGALLHVTRIPDSTTALARSPSWHPAADAGAYGGSVTASKGPGATAVYRFSGRDVAWIASRGPDHGKAKVYLDGTYVTTVDLYAPAPDVRRIVYAKHWATSGTHQLKVVVRATSTRPWVDIDGFFRLS
ncbi:MAG TPA: hypothetical protein VFI34_01515 [Candidatus Limnocylindrales bacterium]|nr:hypothetical protein [Candidatus Limnocylindrales bacterium]